MSSRESDISTNNIIVDDTFWGAENVGPYPAVKEFLEKHPEFQIDKSKEKYLFTFIPNGFLFKI